MHSHLCAELGWDFFNALARQCLDGKYALDLFARRKRLLEMPEAYWAAITTLIVMQSTLGAALQISAKRFAGTAMGCVLGALLASHFGANVAVFGAATFAIGIVCDALHLDRTAYRYAGITLAIVMLVVHTGSAWIVGMQRFIEVAVGIAVGPGPDRSVARRRTGNQPNMKLMARVAFCARRRVGFTPRLRISGGRIRPHRCRPRRGLPRYARRVRTDGGWERPPGARPRA